MKNKYYIIAFIFLTLSSIGIAVFVKKELAKKAKKDKINDTKDSETDIDQPKETIPRELDRPLPNSDELPTKPRELDRPLQLLNVESNIEVAVNTEARSFTYDMHYNGIAVDGTFKDGEADVQIKKSFGSFHIIQRASKAKFVGDNSQKIGAKKDKMNGNITYQKVGNAIVDIKAAKQVAIINNSNWVDLLIKDKQGVILRSLSVSLMTGSQVGSIAPPKWDGN